MREIHIFLFILSVILSVLITIASVSWYFAATAPTYFGSSWMGQMWSNNLERQRKQLGKMGGVMGDGSGYGTPTTSYLLIIPKVDFA